MRGTRYTACYPVSNAIQTVCSIRSLQDFYSNTGQQVIDKDQNRAEKQELSQRAASKRKKIKKSSSSAVAWEAELNGYDALASSLS